MKPHHTMHTLHFILSIILAGFWIPFWVWRASANAKYNRQQEWKMQKEQTEALIKLANKP